MEARGAERESGAANLAADLAVCGRIIRDGSKSFHAASLLLPRDVRAAAYALYAFCRVSDDAVDTGADPLAALDAVRRRLDRAYAGEPDSSPVDRAFAWVVGTYAIPHAVPAALVEGFAWDADGRRFETIADVKAYAARVAATVGVMMTLVMGVRAPAALARACDLGIAMQLTNIARDIGEDARAGRCYLPLSWMRDAGVTPAALAGAGTADEPVRALTARMLAAAQPHYDAGVGGIAMLPEPCRPAIRAAAAIYAEIGQEIARGGHDSIARRAVVSRRRKVALAANAFIPARTKGASREAPPDPSCAFLITAVEHSAPPVAAVTTGLRSGSPPWAIELFLRLEQRDLQFGTG